MLHTRIAARGFKSRSGHLPALKLSLERAHALSASAVLDDVINMNRRVRELDLTVGQRHELTLVLPANADLAAQRISAPVPLWESHCSTIAKGTGCSG